jgi:DNA-binding transcriptional LysR family regulator
LGFVSGALDGPVADEMYRLMKSSDRYRFHITEGSAKELVDLLHQEKLDMAIVDVTSRDRSLHFRKLRQRGFSVAVPENHPLAGRESLCVSDLADYPQIGFSHSMDKNFEDWATHPDTPKHFVCQVNTVSSALSLVSAGLGVTTIPTECILPVDGLCYIPLENRHQALYSCIVYDRWLSPPVWEFVEQVIKSAKA